MALDISFSKFRCRIHLHELAVMTLIGLLLSIVVITPLILIGTLGSKNERFSSWPALTIGILFGSLTICFWIPCFALVCAYGYSKAKKANYFHGGNAEQLFNNARASDTSSPTVDDVTTAPQCVLSEV